MLSCTSAYLRSVRALAAAAFPIFAGLLATAASPPAQPPNFVVIFADDLGYGDFGCYGHPTLDTPNIDRLAAEGMRFTTFYSAESVCTPSRAALLTGRLPVRSGMWGHRIRVLNPTSTGGLPDDEITIAEQLAGHGYATACIGKWHLGHLPKHLPMHHGFESWFGLPYSNDMDPVQPPQPGVEPDYRWWNVPLMRGEDIIERPADQRTLTQRYTQEAVATIARLRDRPFFLYLAHTAPHVPLFRSPGFENVSRRGRYGDVVEELDWSVGQVIDALRSHGIEQRTLVVITSDNGPWLTMGVNGGAAGGLRDGKGSTWEGGFRVPAIAWWPGTVPAGRVCRELTSTLDVFPTLLALAGAPVPNDRLYDGYDLSAVLRGTGPSPRQEMFFYRGSRLFAMRLAGRKVHWITQTGYGGGPPEMHDPPLLFAIDHDPGEASAVYKYDEVLLADIADRLAHHLGGLQIAPSQLDGR